MKLYGQYNQCMGSCAIEYNLMLYHHCPIKQLNKDKSVTNLFKKTIWCISCNGKYRTAASKKLKLRYIFSVFFCAILDGVGVLVS